MEDEAIDCDSFHVLYVQQFSLSDDSQRAPSPAYRLRSVHIVDGVLIDGLRRLGERAPPECSSQSDEEARALVDEHRIGAIELNNGDKLAVLDELMFAGRDVFEPCC